jgi:hypothetical protein
MSEHIEKLIAFLQDPNHVYIYNVMDDIKELNCKIEKEKKLPLSSIEPQGLPWYEQRQFED